MTPVAPGAAATVILAGTRPAGDPLAASAGAVHKGLMPVAGVPMLVRVVTALAATPVSGQIVVSIAHPEIIFEQPQLRALVESGRLRSIPCADRPSESVAAALDALPLPLLVTTADHALLRSEWVDYFWSALPAQVDAVAGIVGKKAVEEVSRDTRRTYLRFADGAVSGCNLFALLTPRARGAVEFWRSVESNRKRPSRMVRRLGVLTAIRFLLGRVTLAEALEVLSRASGACCAAVEMKSGEAAIDVDSPSDLELAERILRARFRDQM